MLKPLALLYGHDGFDQDVNINLSSMYKKLGLSVYASRILGPADLVCITRTPLKPINLSQYSTVHIFDYVCIENGDFLSSLVEHNGATIFFPSKLRMIDVLEKFPDLERISRVLLPPVASEKWVPQKTFERNILKVHIGNYKPYYSEKSDLYANQFLSIIEGGEVDVWGERWNLADMGEKFHGRSALYEVSRIYSKAHVALGMMYPFQRNLTISGRFWHAPLNGCIVYSEPNKLAENIPGVTEYDINATEMLPAVNTQKINPYELAEQARDYWDTHFRECLGIVAEHLKNVRTNTQSRITSKKILNHRYRIKSEIRDLYYRYEFDK